MKDSRLEQKDGTAELHAGRSTESPLKLAELQLWRPRSGLPTALQRQLQQTGSLHQASMPRSRFQQFVTMCPVEVHSKVRMAERVSMTRSDTCCSSSLQHSGSSCTRCIIYLVQVPS